MIREKKNKRLAALLLLWILAIAIVYWAGRSDNHDEVPRDLFKVPDLSAIDQVVLVRDHDSVRLRYNGSRWTVNDRYPGDPQMIDVLFATLQQAEPRRPVSPKSQDSVVQRLRQLGTTVELYSAGKKVMRFVAGGNESKTQAYFLQPDADQVFLMAIPGYRVYVSGIFEMKEAGWRNRVVFGFNWRNFQQLQMEYPAQPDDGFEVAMDKDYFGVRGLAQVDTTKLNDFLDAVSLLEVDEYVQSTAALDSLSSQTPEMIMQVADVGQKIYRLEVFPGDRGRSYYLGLIDRRQWARLDPRRIRPLLRTRDFFKK